MFERPQYNTPGGLRRKAKNPTKKKNSQLIIPKKQELLEKGKNLNKNNEGKGISKEAAKLIAQAIKGMLKQ